VILIAAGVLVLGPGDRPSAEISRWIGIIAAALAAISAIFVMPYYPVWSLIYIAIAIMVIYGLSARYGEQAADSRPPAAGGRDPAAEQASHRVQIGSGAARRRWRSSRGRRARVTCFGVMAGLWMESCRPGNDGWRAAHGADRRCGAEAGNARFLPG